MSKKQIQFSWELTDTFGGDPNYSWVRRGKITMPENASDAQVKRAAKAAAGYTGCRGEWRDYGDAFEFRPRGICQVLFVNYDDSAE